jgi:membrane protein YdbS with pleckstrin-like domain
VGLCDADDMSAVSPFEPVGVQWTAVSPRLALARRLIVTVPLALTAMAAAIVAWLLGWTWLNLVAVLLLALTGWTWWLIGRQVRSWGYAERDDDLLLRHGVMWRRLLVVPYGRLQFVDVEAGPLASGLGIAHVQLHTASAHSDAAIPGVPAAEAARLRDRLASRGEAQLAGL